ncbi:hypothetical protein ABIA45_002889 [Bradyrhizobium sp. USDA 336]
MPGLVPGIHVLCAAWQGVDGRDKPGHDDVETIVPKAVLLIRENPAPAQRPPSAEAPSRFNHCR